MKAALEWGATLPLTAEQRAALGTLCCRIGGSVPRAELIAERRKRQEAERRAEELEARLTKQ
ncbi:unnamed protein product, partial [marine sediment metagenome]